MPRPRNIYDIYEGDQLVFSGTSGQVVEAFGMSSPTVNTYAKEHKLLNGRYRVVMSKEIIKYQLTDRNGNVVYVGTSDEIGKKFGCEKCWISNYASHKQKFMGCTVTVFVEKQKVNECTKTKKAMSKLDQDYVWIKKQLLNEGNTTYHRRLLDELMSKLKGDGIECYSVPSWFEPKKDVVIYRV